MPTLPKADLARSRAEVFKALAHHSRMLIVSHLANGDSTVGELTGLIGAGFSTASRHLAVLRKAGLLTTARDGNRIIHRLKCPCIMEFIHCIDDVILQGATDNLQCVLPGVRLTGDGAIPGIALEPVKESMDED